MRGRQPPARLYELLSVCLRYPDRRLFDGRNELRGAVGALPRSRSKESLLRFLEHLDGEALLDLERRYVETFDLRRPSSLYLTYYLHGDTRKRGMALLRLKRLYAAGGLELAGGELPDYLPLVLEFCALAPAEVAERLLREHRLPLELLRQELHDAESPYAHALDALCSALPRLTALERERIGRLQAEGPPSEQVGLEPFAPPEVMPVEARV